MRPAVVVFSAVLLFSPAYLHAKAQNISSLMQTNRQHDTADWANISAHLPDPATAPLATVELAADVLRARRYDSDALRFYSTVLQRGGDPQVLYKKMGITCLEMQEPTLARFFFQKLVRLTKKDAIAWNDLGAADFTLQNNRGAIGAYKKAIKLDRDSAVFHSNLALVYFETSDTEDARHELAKALELDPDLLHKQNENGYSAQILATARYGEICFEMARIYAMQGNVAAMLDWLTKASERGYDIRNAMDRDSTLRPLLADARVQLILKNTRLLRAGNKAPVSVPSLGDSPK